MTPEKLVAIADIAIGIGLGLFLVFVVVLVVRSFRVKKVDADPETARRFWTLHRPDGSVPLGTMTQLEAVTAAAKLGARVTFVDREFALIFADTHLQVGGGQEYEG
jgi:hypothetical protein